MRHIDLVGILFVVWGALTLLVGVSTLALGMGALAIMTSARRTGGSEVAAGLTAVLFTTLALIAIAWGIAHVAVGVPVRRRKASARIMALVLGSVDLVLLPYGTALGIYALWTLLSEENKKEFRNDSRIR